LQAEGLQVELLLIENMQNEEVRRLMAEEADILAEQFVACAYAMSGMEGMASGLPVMANLDLEVYTRLYRRYGYLDECPILSTTIESLADNLRLLVTQPGLRKQLGMAGRTYMEKYHSPRTAQFLFSRIYDRIWHGREGTLCNLFHPILGEYALGEPLVHHPLIENKLAPVAITAS
jgi:glycosyltransferase involved in cell wall biosynthesis